MKRRWLGIVHLHGEWKVGGKQEKTQGRSTKEGIVNIPVADKGMEWVVS